MSAAAIIMMLFAMLVLWGGLAVAIVSLSRSDRAIAETDASDQAHRDL